MSKATNFSSSAPATPASTTPTSTPEFSPAQVYVRIRPFASTGYHGQAIVENTKLANNHKKIDSFTDTTITLTDANSKKLDLYKYPKAIIKPEVNQADAFKMLKLPEKIDYFIKGHNCTAIAYGQTGSGKTHTMFGPPSLAKEIRQMNDVDINQESTFPAEWGIFARTILTIFKQMEKLKSSDSSVFYFSATIIEIYFMEVYDLLNEKKKVPTSPHQAGEFDYGKAKEMKIENANDVAKIAQIIMTKRNSRSTSCNDTSSRSHCICTLNLICITNRNGQKNCPKKRIRFRGFVRIRKDRKN
jgi:hypothetical protein